jgi:glycosyltransferase involved in cell wall biosynthesis
MRKLRIQFTLPFLNLAGGNKCVLEYANRLKARGHDVWLIYGYPDIPFWKPRGFSLMMLRDWGVLPWINWFDVRVPIVRCPDLANDCVPDADVVLATTFHWVPYVAKLGASKGRQFNLIQAYETDYAEDKTFCDSTYGLPPKHIVNASWVGRVMWEKFQRPSVKVIPAADFEQFEWRPSREYHTPPRCLMQYHDHAVKGVEDGIKAFELAAREVSGMTLTFYGPRSVGLRTPHRVAGMVPMETMSDLYYDHDIFIWPSHREGLGTPCIEAMACKCAVATTDNGGSEEFAFHEQTALVSPPRDVKALAENIVRLAKDVPLRRRLAEVSCDWVRRHITWDRACDGLERCFVDDTLWKGPNSPALSEQA